MSRSFLASPARFLLPLGLVASLTLCAALLAGCPSPAERAASARAEAVQALADGRRARAVQALERMRAAEPDTPEALIDLGQLLVQAGEAAQAVWLLEEGLARFPERDDLRVVLGATALLTSDPALAKRVLELVPASSPQHPAALLTLANAELQLGHLERALDVIREGEERYPELAAFQLRHIATLLGENRFDEARSAIELARPAANEEMLRELRSFEAWAHLAEVRAAVAAKGDPTAPLAALRALVAEDVATAPLWQAFVEGYATASRTEEALTIVEQAARAKPESFDLQTMLARLQALLGRGDEAEATLTALVEKSPSPGAWLSLGSFYSAQDRLPEAVSAYTSAVDAYPDQPFLRKYRVEALLTAGDLDGARVEFGRFRGAAPRDPNVEYLLARIELAEGDARAAVARLTQLVPELDQAATQFWLGAALEASGDLAGAKLRYDNAISRDPSQPTPYRGAIHLAERRGDWRNIVGLAEALARTAPDAVDGWVALASALLHLDEPVRAERVARHAVSAFPEEPQPRSLLVRALLGQRRFDEALRELDAAPAATGAAREKADPDPSLQFAIDRSLALALSGRLDEGVALARVTLAEHPEDARLHAGLAALLFQQGHAEEGAEAVDRALALAPDDLVPLRVRAQFRTASGRFEEARADCERYLESRTDDAGVHFLLAVAHEKSGRPDAAAAAYRRAAALDPNAFAPRNNLADLLQRQGDLDGALAAGQEAHALAPDDPYVADTVGWLYFEKGLVERGVSLLEQAHRGAPEHPVVQLHLALAYLERDATRDRARALLEDLDSRLANRADVDASLRAQVDDALRRLR